MIALATIDRDIFLRRNGRMREANCAGELTYFHVYYIILEIRGTWFSVLVSPAVLAAISKYVKLGYN